MNDQEQLDQLLDTWTESRENGDEATGDQICADYPHLRAELEKRITAVRAIDALRVPRETGATVASDDETIAPPGPAISPIAFAPGKQPGEIGRIGDYRILKQLGEGGMGAVYLAEHLGLKRLDALKVMRPEAATSPQAKDRFLREARTAASIKHDHVVTIYHVGDDNGTPFIAMELLEGQSLEDRIKNGPPLTPVQMMQIGREIAEGLAAAHNRGLIHRDVKPGNVWLETSGMRTAEFRSNAALRSSQTDLGRVKLLDFGLARPLEVDVQISHAGTVVGSPAYMSPEQAAGQDLDGRSDLFSLGVVMYRIATGRMPFHGSNILAILRQIDMHDPPAPEEVNSTLPHPLSELIIHLLAKSPKDRPVSAVEVAQALLAIERGEASTYSGKTSVYPVPAKPKPERSRRGWIIAAVVAVVIFPLLALGAIAVLGALGATWLALSPTETVRGSGPIVESHEERLITPATDVPQKQAPLKGWIDMRVWAEKDGPDRRLNRPESVPVGRKEFVRVEVKLNRPAYVYVIWLDSEGGAEPMYPWVDKNWIKRVPETPRDRLAFPDGEGLIAPMSEGRAGVECLLLLCRDDPLPEGEDLKMIFENLPKQKGRDINVAAWFENGELVQNERDRGAIQLDKAVASEDPVMVTQSLLRTKLKGLFPYTRAVCFGCKGD